MTEDELRWACVEAGLGFEYENGVAAASAYCIKRLAEIVERRTLDKVLMTSVSGNRAPSDGSKASGSVMDVQGTSGEPLKVARSIATNRCAEEMPASPSDKDIIEALAGGAIIYCEVEEWGYTYEVRMPGKAIPGSTVNRLIDQGWLSGPGSLRLSDAGHLAYMRSVDEMGPGELISPKDMKSGGKHD